MAIADAIRKLVDATMHPTDSRREDILSELPAQKTTDKDADSDDSSDDAAKENKPS